MVNIIKSGGPIVDTVAFDFDATIAKYDGWKGDLIMGEPIPKEEGGVIDTMRQLKSEGFRIIIFSTRKNSPVMQDYLKKYDIPCDEYIEGKPLYKCLVDDRTVNPIGNSDIYSDIKKVINRSK
jgi:hypothetical protein